MKKGAGILCIILLGMAMACGCGKESVQTGSSNQVVYVPEFSDIDMENGYLNQIREADGSFYIIANEYIEETGQSKTRFLKKSMTDGKVEELPLFDMAENEYINTMVVNAAGNFGFLTSVYNDVTEHPEKPELVYHFYEVTKEGSVAADKDMSDIMTAAGGKYIQQSAMDALGNLYLFLDDGMGKTSIAVIDPAGKVICKIAQNDYINSLFCADDGNVYITSWGNMGQELKKLDLTAKSLSNAISLENIRSMGNLYFGTGGTTGTLVSDGSSIYECDPETGKCTELLNWMDCDINATNISQFGMNADGRLWAVNQIYEQEKSRTELIVMTATTADKIPQKEIITFGTMWTGSDIQNAIVKFNKANSQYRIKLKEYATDDYEAGMAQFNADLTGNNCPDIINLSSVNFNQLAAKGVLAELTPMLEADKDIIRDDYLENALQAYIYNGKMYGIMPSFMVNALAGSAKTLEGIDSWNIQEMMAFARKYPDAKLFNSVASSVLFTFVASNMEQFVNWETGVCSFNSDDFIAILEFANTFDKESDWQSPGRIGTHEGLSTGKFLLLEQYVSEINMIQVMEGMFDGPVKFIGYPSGEKSGIMMSPGTSSLAISAKSRQKEGAWEFLSYLLSDEYQGSFLQQGYWGIPIKKSFIDRLCEEAMIDEYTTDENGNKTRSTKTSWGYDDITIDIYASTQAQVDQFKKLIDSAQGLYHYDTQMYNIITEETESFFAGQKSAQEVADIIQSRIQIYVNENK